VLHVVAASVWIGGLVVLMLAAFPATRNLSLAERTSVLAPVVARFSALAFWAVALIVLTGVFAAWVQVQGLSALFGTSYGVALLIKVGAFLPLVAMGGINRRWMIPRLERAAAEGDTSAPLGILKRLITAEVGLAVLVIAVTAVLVNLAPARNLFEVQDGFQQRIEIDDRTYLLTIDPNSVGDNEVELMLEEMGSAMGGGGSDDETTNHDEPANMAGGPKEVTVLFRMPNEGIGPLPVKARETEQGHFVVRGHQLSVPGRWQLELVVRISRFEEERHEVAVDVNPR
jgi:copper transport protein